MKDHQKMSMYEPDEPLYQQPSRLLNRLLVLMLYLSFFACLAAFWFTGTPFGNPGLPLWLRFTIESNRSAILIAPLVCLLACYLALRHSTSDIMASPERYLDERQKMLRDQAHSYAYRVVKFACLFIPLFFCLHNMFPAAQPDPAPVTYQFSSSVMPTDLATAYREILMREMLASARGVTVINTGKIDALKNAVMIYPYAHPAPALPTPWPNDPTSITIYYGVLLLSLFLMASVLPMTIIAWRGRR